MRVRLWGLLRVNVKWWGAGSYGEQLAGKMEVATLCQAVRDALDATEVRAMAFRQQLLRFSHWWGKQPSVSLQVWPQTFKHRVCLTSTDSHLCPNASHIAEVCISNIQQRDQKSPTIERYYIPGFGPSVSFGNIYLGAVCN